MQSETTSFYNVLQRTLNHASNSRPPKIELKGVLIPTKQKSNGNLYKFKLETDSREYLLSMNKALLKKAEAMAWEEVAVKGYLDLETQVLEAEIIQRLRISDSNRYVSIWTEPYYELESYKKAIQQCGMIEPALDELVS